MNHQELLLKTIRKQLTTTSSLIDEIAVVLSISYDAAHRRVSMKSKFSIEETIMLCHHYGFSMDAIFSNQNKVMVEKTKEVKSFDDMVSYFEQSSNYLKQYATSENTTLFYSAKDIPLFYTIGGTLLSKFKLYVWLNLLIGTENQEAFEKFQLTKPFQEYTEILKTVYENSNVSEIWNDTTINSTLQQINYFYESGLLTLQNATLLYEEMKKMLQLVEEKCSKNNPKYHLYFNELLILNNNVLVSNENTKSLFIPYTMLGYFITEDKATCENASDYYLHQIKNSKSLNLSGTRDRKVFFNKAKLKIDYYLQKLNFQNDFDYI
ncbi:hypothetical protein OX283_000195 [Flavobacterium sp. SUN052]|uniref:hypothetical protein n=1 Tax=Flavobacterium sp. SUN052 TaxID=3002441 RepID=UPI00237E4C72|nr:hypothetical protein [Flavobacterium sp. SUN052]MEC4003063.1 hypothetical protein [Flavobacterium sp. SUN052]